MDNCKFISGTAKYNNINSLRKIHFINFSRRLTITTIFFLIPLYLLQIGYKGWQIGVINSLFAFAPLLFAFPTGWINDRFSIKGVIQGSLITLIVFFLVIGFIRKFILMSFLFLILGFVNNALDISANSLYYKDDAADMDVNKKFGLLNFWLSIGMAIGVLIGGLLTHYTNFHVLFILYAVYVFFVLIVAFRLKDAHYQIIPFNKYKLSLLNKKTLLFSLLIFVLTLHWGVEGTVFSPFLKEYFHLNNLQLALYISISLFALSFASLSICLLKHNKLINERIFLLSMFLSGFGHIFMVWDHVLISFLFRVIHEIGDGFLAALIFVYISRLFEKKNIGGSSGILIAVMTLGQMVGSLIFSFIGYNIGLQYPFIISGVLLIANTFFGYYIFKNQEY